MSRGFFVELDGLPKVLANIKKYPSELQQEIALEIGATAKEIERKASRRAPKDTGLLQGAITARPLNALNWEVVAQKTYAPYVEFGTGALVDVPKGLEDYAIQFKGRGVRKVNLPARPFLFPSYFEETRKLIKKLKDELKAR